MTVQNRLELAAVEPYSSTTTAEIDWDRTELNRSHSTVATRARSLPGRAMVFSVDDVDREKSFGNGIHLADRLKLPRVEPLASTEGTLLDLDTMESDFAQGSIAGGAGHLGLGSNPGRCRSLILSAIFFDSPIQQSVDTEG